jgi:tetratricopeptide (TPR) repeat protein
MKKLFVSLAIFFTVCLHFCIAQNTNYQENSIANLIKKSQEKLREFDYVGALEDCETAIAVCPSCSSPYFQQVVIYTVGKKYNEAEKALKKACKLSTNIKDNVRHEVYLKYYSGKIDDAFALIQKEIDKDTSKNNLAYWYDLRASYFTYEKKYKLAYNDYCKLISMYPNNNRILALMIIHEIHVNEKEKYEQHMKEFTFKENGKDSASIFYNKGLFSYYLKDYHTALTYFNCAIQVKKDMNQALVLKAVNLALLNKFDSTFYFINKALEKNKNNAYFLYNRGFIYTLAGNFDSAIVDLEKSIALNEKDPHPYNTLAYIYSKTDTQKSKTYQQKANEIGGKEHVHYWKLDY